MMPLEGRGFVEAAECQQQSVGEVSSSEEFSLTAIRGRKIKRRRASHPLRHKKALADASAFSIISQSHKANR